MEAYDTFGRATQTKALKVAPAPPEQWPLEAIRHTQQSATSRSVMTCAGSVRSAARFLDTLGYPTGTPVPSKAGPCWGFVYLGLFGHRPVTQWLPVLAAPVLLFAAEEARKAVARRRRAGRRTSTVGAVRG
jgi:hypothetical protein